MDNRIKSPRNGGRMRGGPYDGKVIAFNSLLIPVMIDGLRIGAYVWAEDHWEWESEE